MDNKGNNTLSFLSMKEIIIILFSGMLLGGIHSYLTYGFDANGLGTFIFNLLFLISIFGLLKIFNIKVNRSFFIVVFTILILGFFNVIRAGWILNTLNYIGIFFGYLLLFKIITKEKFSEIKSIDYFPGFIKTFFGVLIGALFWLSYIINFCLRSIKVTNKTHIIRGVFISFIFLFIFISLFASADLVFNKIILTIFNFDWLYSFALSQRSINTLFFGGIFIGFFTYIALETREFNTKNESKVSVYNEKKLIEINIILSVISLLFFIFTLIQIGYLFSGESFIVSQGYTYSEYAKRGFVQLAFSAFIVFILLWKCDEYLNGNTNNSSSSYKTLASILISLTILILFSALYRLYLYENAYGFTEMRFYGYVLIAIFFSSLVIMLYKILFFMNEGIFISINVYFYFLGLIFVNIFNPEAFISEHNTTKIYSSSLRTDFSYIGGRSFDAIDGILESYSKSYGEDAVEMQKRICNMIHLLEKRNTDWRGYNYSFTYASNALSPLRSSLNCGIQKFNN